MLLAKAGFSDIIVWSMVLMGVLIAGLVVTTRIKRRLTEGDEPSGGGFTLSDLREMHRSGQMSAEEFDMAKGRLIAGLKGGAAPADASRATPRQPAPPVAAPEGGDGRPASGNNADASPPAAD